MRLSGFLLLSLAIHLLVVFAVGFSLDPMTEGAATSGVVQLEMIETHSPGQHAQAVQAHRATKPPPSPSAVEAPLDRTSSGFATAASEDGSARAAGLTSYTSELAQLIRRYRVYPASAIAREQEGRVVLEVILDSQGRVVAVSLEEKSVFQALNEAALETIQRIPQFPPPPSSLQGSHFLVPLVFKIERR